MCREIMGTHRVSNWKSIGAAALLAVAAAGPAQAIVYQGNFDPHFVLGGSDYFYSGVAKFDVPSGCLGTDGTINFLSPPVGCPLGSVKLLSASIDLYNAAFVSGDWVTVGGPFETLTYGLIPSRPAAPAIPTLLNADLVTSIDVLAGQLTSLSTKEFGGVYSVDLAQWFSLSFNASGKATLSTAVCSELHGGEADVETYTYADFDEYCTVSTDTNNRFVASATSFALDVPEPGSLAFVGGALAVAGVLGARRRRSA
jgi:hypothetical protein